MSAALRLTAAEARACGITSPGAPQADPRAQWNTASRIMLALADHGISSEQVEFKVFGVPYFAVRINPVGSGYIEIASDGRALPSVSNPTANVAAGLAVVS
jgi:hypothetical protein